MNSELTSGMVLLTNYSGTKDKLSAIKNSVLILSLQEMIGISMLLLLLLFCFIFVFVLSFKRGKGAKIENVVTGKETHLL